MLGTEGDFLDQLLNSLSVKVIVTSLEKWGLSIFLLLHGIFSVMISRQISLLHQFIPTKGGKVLRVIGFIYTTLAWLLFILSLLTL